MDSNGKLKYLMSTYFIILQRMQLAQVFYDREIKHNLRKRRRLLAQIMRIHTEHTLNLAALASIKSRLIWKKFRPSVFWEQEVATWTNCQFKENFRMKKKNFNLLCSLLKNMKKNDTNYRLAIPLEKRIAIALYCLGSSAEYRTVGNLFGVAKSTVCTVLREFCMEAWRVLHPIYLNGYPLNNERVEECIKGFSMLGFPQCIGALDGTHIEIRPKSEDAVDYYNYKGWYSMVLLALVDYRYRFLYINVGSPGRCNDSQIFEASLLKKYHAESPIIWEHSSLMNNVTIPALIISDSAFKARPWLMKPYPFDLNADTKHKRYNYTLSKSRRVVENAFGHLKARFRRIGKGIDNRVDNAPSIIKVCCALHNFLNNQDDSINNKWYEAIATLNNHRPQPDQIEIIENNVVADTVRNAIADLLDEPSTPANDTIFENNCEE